MDPADNLLDLLGTDRKIPFDQMTEDFSNYNEPISDYPWDTSRLRGVIEKVVEESSWRHKPPKGVGQGICAHRSFLTYVACVVSVKKDIDGQITIPEIHYAVDCGLAVNPDRIRSQFKGGAVFALSFALKSQITLKDGRVEQSNFDDYELARITDTPERVHVHIVDSNEKPTGVGEPPVPPIAPALCNALYQLTGTRHRELPLRA
jgi:isoquinoline 1-oxidoreductase beta subunit